MATANAAPGKDSLAQSQAMREFAIQEQMCATLSSEARMQCLE
jgi:hypothetical protein